MDAASFLAKLYNIRNQILFFWQNPTLLKTELLANRQLLLEVVLAIIVFVALLFMLFKPSKKKAAPQTTERSLSNNIASAEANLPKTFSKALVEQQKKEPVFSNRPVRQAAKKTEPVSVQDLTDEEERALKEAMSIAGKQALADATGEPLQTEFFENSQAADAAKKIFAGQVRGQDGEAEADLGAEKSSPTPGAFEFIMIYFMAPRSQAFEGEALFSVLRDLGLRLNDHHVFEYADEEGVQFYVSSALKPGHFDIHRLNYTVPGVSFVLDLDAPTNPEAAFQKMLAMVHELSQMLKGDILDEYRQRLTQANIYQYMARIRAFHK